MLAICVLLVACGDGGTEFVVEPPPGDTGTGGGGTVTRTALAVQVITAGEDSAAAVAAGWAEGRVPRAQVTIQRSGEQQVRTAETDAQGWARFSDLLPGSYSIRVLRLLEPAEAERLSSTAFREVNAFGGGAPRDVKAPADTARVAAVAGQRGSLVISELNAAFYRSETQLYEAAHFMEIYNNSDTTIYLDGKIVARGFWFIQNIPERPCADVEHLRLDPEGIWSENHVQFPGGGRSYPVEPGESVVLARDAIDHRQFFPGTPDLSRADFESIGRSDVDNPAVPNVIDIGTRLWDTVLDQRGWFMTAGHEIIVLAEPFDLASVPHETIAVPERQQRRIPRDKILDVVSVLIPTYKDFDWCLPQIHPIYDRASAPIHDRTIPASITRKVLGRLPDSRVILQRTRTSASDFERAAQSPGSVP